MEKQKAGNIWRRKIFCLRMKRSTGKESNIRRREIDSHVNQLTSFSKVKNIPIFVATGSGVHQHRECDILACFGQFLLFCCEYALFGVLFTGLNSVVVYQNTRYALGLAKVWFPISSSNASQVVSSWCRQCWQLLVSNLLNCLSSSLPARSSSNLLSIWVCTHHNVSIIHLIFRPPCFRTIFVFAVRSYGNFWSATSILHCTYNQGRVPAVRLPNRMNFWNDSKRPLTPPPLIFRKSCCKFLIMDMVAYMQGGMKARQYEMHAHALFKVCLILIFLNTIVEKTYPEP